MAAILHLQLLFPGQDCQDKACQRRTSRRQQQWSRQLKPLQSLLRILRTRHIQLLSVSCIHPDSCCQFFFPCRAMTRYKVLIQIPFCVNFSFSAFFCTSYMVLHAAFAISSASNKPSFFASPSNCSSVILLSLWVMAIGTS